MPENWQTRRQKEFASNFETELNRRGACSLRPVSVGSQSVGAASRRPTGLIVTQIGCLAPEHAIRIRGIEQNGGQGNGDTNEHNKQGFRRRCRLVIAKFIDHKIWKQAVCQADKGQHKQANGTGKR